MAQRLSAGRIEFRDVSAHHGRVAAVVGASLIAEPGERVAVVGANGSGKSTLLRCLLCLHPGAMRGQVLLDGVLATTGAQVRDRRARIAHIPQRPPVGRFPFRVGELLDSSGARDAARNAARDLGLAGLMDRPVDTLSGGQVQRAFLARAIGCVAAGAVAIAADEPTSALDFDGQDEVARVLLGLGVTTLLVTHDDALARRCDRRVTMAAGRLREER